MTKQDNTIKYFLYARKSTETEDRQVASIGDQIREMKKIAKERGLEIVQVFEESKSAKNLGRPVFGEMIKQIQKGKANGIICWKADRLARNMIDGGLLIDMLGKSQIAHIQAYDADYRSADNVIILAVAFGFSTQYSKDLAVNVKRGMKSRAERGWYPNQVPLGYKTFRENAKAESLVIKDNNFLLVKKMFQYILEKQCSVPELCDYAYKIGLKTKQGKKIWVSNMHHILRNSFYYGKFEWPKNSGNWYKGKHKPIISYEEHSKIQKIITRITKPKYEKIQGEKNDFTYRGLLTCKQCGSSITATKVKKQQKNGNKHEYIYYHCTKRKDKNCTQKSMPIKQENLEEQILKVISELNISKAVFNWSMARLAKDENEDNKDQDNIVKGYEQALAREKNKLDGFSDMRANKEIPQDEYLEKRIKITKTINHYEELIKKSNNNQEDKKKKITEAYELVNELKEKFKGTDKDENINKNNKKSIILNLGSNPLLEDKKVHFYLDLRLQPFQEYAKEANEEMEHVQTYYIGEDYAKATHCEVANTMVWAE